MATKTQRDFNKQMKEFEKQGKIPDSYRPRYKTVRYTSSVGFGILAVLFVLWYSGAFSWIFGLFMMNSSRGMNEIIENSYEIREYIDSAGQLEAVLEDAYIAAYQCVSEGKDIGLDTLRDFREKINNKKYLAETDKSELKVLEGFYLNYLGEVEEYIDFVVNHFENREGLSDADKTYMNNLASKIGKTSDKIDKEINSLLYEYDL